MAGAGWVFFMFAFLPEWRSLDLAARIRITLFGVVFVALYTYLTDRFIHPLMERFFEKVAERRERKKLERERMEVSGS